MSVWGRRVGFPLVALFLAVVASLVLAEVGIRVSRVSRIQIVRSDSAARPYVDDGVLLFDAAYSDMLASEDCVDGEKRVAVFVGDSIMYAAKWDISAEYGNFVVFLRERFQGEGWCFVNLSAPGYTGWQQDHLVKKALERYDPDIVFWGLWKSDGEWLELNSDTWVDLGPAGVPLDAQGFPELPLPKSIHHALFRRSRLWQEVAVTASLRLMEVRYTNPMDGFTLIFDSANRCAQAQVPFVVVDFPGLDKPFAESAREVRYPEVVEALTGRGVAVVNVAEELIDDDHVAIRADRCCHYNVDGNRRLADLFEARIRALIAESTPDPSPVPPP